jgi:hypothetical protein
MAASRWYRIDRTHFRSQMRSSFLCLPFTLGYDTEALRSFIDERRVEISEFEHVDEPLDRSVCQGISDKCKRLGDLRSVSALLVCSTQGHDRT